MKQNNDTSFDNFRHLIAENLLLGGLYYLHKEQAEKCVLCFDDLLNPYSEISDAYIFFRYLQSRGIPTKYVALADTNFTVGLLNRGLKDDDVLITVSLIDILSSFAMHIASAAFAITTCGLGDYDQVLRTLPYLQYVCLGDSTGAFRMPATGNYDKILSPALLGKNIGVQFSDAVSLYCGMPHWDGMHRREHNEKNILICFSAKADWNNFKECVRRTNSLARRLRGGRITGGANVKILIDADTLIKFPRPQDIRKLFPGCHIINVGDRMQELETCDLFITDYSDCALDCALLDIPVIFYNHGEEHARIMSKNKWLDQQKIKLSRDVIEKHLYNLVLTDDECIRKIEYYAKRNYEPEPELKEKNKRLFHPGSRDGKNCERLAAALGLAPAAERTQ